MTSGNIGNIENWHAITVTLVTAIHSVCICLTVNVNFDMCSSLFWGLQEHVLVKQSISQWKVALDSESEAGWMWWGQGGAGAMPQAAPMFLVCFQFDWSVFLHSDLNDFSTFDFLAPLTAETWVILRLSLGHIYDQGCTYISCLHSAARV